jgi:hypothetical protein
MLYRLRRTTLIETILDGTRRKLAIAQIPSVPGEVFRPVCSSAIKGLCIDIPAGILSTTTLVRGGKSMDNNALKKNKPLSPQEQAAKAAILAECDNLSAAGITFVTVHFDGYGDEGTTEEVKCHAADWFGSDEHEPVQYDASRLQEHFEALVPFGYENDCGGFGDVVLDVRARKLTVERNDRFEDYTTSRYEV